MATNDRPNEFAFGDDHVEDAPCPALFVDGDVTGHAVDLAEHYDEMCRDETGHTLGTLDWETAREMWINAVEMVESRATRAEDIEEARYYETMAEEGRRIQRQAF